MQCTIQQKHSDRIGAKPKAPNKTKFTPINPNGLHPIRSLLLCIPLHSSASRKSVAFHRAPRTSRALLSCLSWCVHSSVPGTGASADLRSRSPFPPDVTFGPAPSLRVRILLQLQQPISSKSPHLFYSCYCTQDLHQNLGTVQYTIEEQKKTTHIA